MPFAHVNDIDIHYEDSGEGYPLIFCHELASDMRAWEIPYRRFSANYRCIRFNCRGYPPTSVPQDLADYSQEALVQDLHSLMQHLGIEKAHIVGVATGGGVALNLALAYPSSVKSLVLVGLGAGSEDRDCWLEGAVTLAKKLSETGMEVLAESMKRAPQRQALRWKDPVGWEQFLSDIYQLSSQGCSNLMANAMVRRKPLYELESSIRSSLVPTLVIVGDQDEPAFNACVFLSKKLRFGALATFPFTGHMVPLEEPDLFEIVVGTFLKKIDHGRWGHWNNDNVQLYPGNE